MRAITSVTVSVTPLVEELVHLLKDDNPDQTKLVETFYRMNPSFLRGRQVRQRIHIDCFNSCIPSSCDFSCISSFFRKMHTRLCSLFSTRFQIHNQAQLLGCRNISGLYVQGRNVGQYRSKKKVTVTAALWVLNNFEIILCMMNAST